MGVIIFIILGLLTSVFGIVMRYKEYKTLKWEKTTGEIKEVKLIENFFDDIHNYSCQIKYSYIINNKTYIGHNITNSQILNGDYENILAYEKLKGAKKVEIYYDYYNENESCLVKGRTTISFGIICFGITILLFSIFMANSITDENSEEQEIIFVKE